MMDDHTINMIRDSLIDLKATCQGIREDMAKHAEVDAQYWKKVDQAEGQISLIKWIGGSLSISGLLGWLFSHFGKH